MKTKYFKLSHLYYKYNTKVLKKRSTGRSAENRTLSSFAMKQKLLLRLAVIYLILALKWTVTSSLSPWDCDYGWDAQPGYSCWFNDWQARDRRCTENGNYDLNRGDRGGRYSFSVLGGLGRCYCCYTGN
jgi:hypothetical protein